jgi:hypothetical protein
MVLDCPEKNYCFQALAGFCDYVMASVVDHDFFRRHEMTKRFLAGVLCGALLAVSSLQAHHSLAGVYDLKKVERATGVVQKLAFTNPHGALHIELKDKDGVAKVWQLTTGSANVLTSAGITATGPDRIKNGDTIEVTYNPALNGTTIGFLRSITLKDKKEVEFAPN